MDLENPIVKLCAAGMQAEFEGRLDDARDLFSQAWQEHKDNFEACIAAHYLARHQDSPEENLRWNALSLQNAEMVADERVFGFFPSLFLNMGHSYEVLGNLDEAARYYDLAFDRLEVLPEDGYGEVVRNAVAEGQNRIVGQKKNNQASK